MADAIIFRYYHDDRSKLKVSLQDEDANEFASTLSDRVNAFQLWYCQIRHNGNKWCCIRVLSDLHHRRFILHAPRQRRTHSSARPTQSNSRAIRGGWSYLRRSNFLRIVMNINDQTAATESIVKNQRFILDLRNEKVKSFNSVESRRHWFISCTQNWIVPETFIMPVKLRSIPDRHSHTIKSNKPHTQNACSYCSVFVIIILVNPLITSHRVILKALNEDAKASKQSVLNNERRNGQIGHSERTDRPTAMRNAQSDQVVIGLPVWLDTRLRCYH